MAEYILGKLSLVQWLIKPLGLKAYRNSSSGLRTGISKIFEEVRKNYFETIGVEHKCKIQSGPFKGLKLISKSSWGDGDLVPKFLGAYELELHGFVIEISNSQCDCVVNVGAAEGYYAAGMKKLMPHVDAYTYDIDPKSPDRVREMAAFNGFKVEPLNAFSFSAPEQELLVDKYSKMVFIIDIEGAESEVPDMPPSVLAKSEFLIELHEGASKGITDILVEFLSPTHHIKIAERIGRDPSDYKLLKHLPDVEKAALLCEFRSDDTPWLYATLK